MATTADKGLSGGLGARAPRLSHQACVQPHTDDRERVLPIRPKRTAHLRTRQEATATALRSQPGPADGQSGPVVGREPCHLRVMHLRNWITQVEGLGSLGYRQGDYKFSALGFKIFRFDLSMVEFSDSFH